MRETNIALKRLELIKFTPRNGEMSISIYVNKDGKEYKIKKDIIFISPMRAMQEIMGEIKKLGKQNTGFGEDILDNIVLVKINKLEDIEELVARFFQRLEERSKQLSKTTNSSEYMRLFNELNTFKMDF